MHVLVTGAAGFIGSHLAERLTRDGHRVVGLDSFSPYYSVELKRANAAHLAAAGIPVHDLDLVADPIDEVLRGVEAIIHLAAQPGLSAATDQRAFVRNNVDATRRLVARCAECSSLRTFVYASSSSVYGADATVPEDGPLAPISAYGRTKLAAERIVRDAGANAAWDACILRLFSVYGPRERPEKLIPKAIRCALERRPFPLFRGSEHHRRSFTYVSDAAEALAAALHRIDDAAGETINVGAPAPTSTLTVLQHVADLTDQPLCIRRVPKRPGDQRRTSAVIDKARRLLQWTPSTSLRKGIANELAHVKANA